MRSARRTLLAAAVCLVLVSPVATWSLVGDLSETTADPDYLIRPFELTAGVEGVVRVASVAIAVAALVILIAGKVRGQWDRHWRAPIVLFAAAGALVGFGWRVLTAGVIGANIGGGMLLLLGAPLFLGLVLAGLVCALVRPSRTVRDL